MKEDLLVPMIFKRKSVRLFSTVPLNSDCLAEVLSFAREATPLFPELRTSFRIFQREDISCSCNLSAQHYLALYSSRSPDCELNSGFLLQQTDLFLSSKGLGSCWLGMARPMQQTCEGLSFVILMGFGTPAEPLHREYRDQFHRKTIKEIASPGAVPQYIEAIRLAPSAMNKQPWFFTGDAHCCHAFSFRGKGLINIAEKWRLIDLGIALAHLYIVAKADSFDVSFRREDSIPSRSGSDYVISCRIL